MLAGMLTALYEFHWIPNMALVEGVCRVSIIFHSTLWLFWVSKNTLRTQIHSKYEVFGTEVWDAIFFRIKESSQLRRNVYGGGGRFAVWQQRMTATRTKREMSVWYVTQKVKKTNKQTKHLTSVKWMATAARVDFYLLRATSNTRSRGVQLFGEWARFEAESLLSHVEIKAPGG